MWGLYGSHILPMLRRWSRGPPCRSRPRHFYLIWHSFIHSSSQYRHFTAFFSFFFKGYSYYQWFFNCISSFFIVWLYVSLLFSCFRVFILVINNFFFYTVIETNSQTKNKRKVCSLQKTYFTDHLYYYIKVCEIYWISPISSILYIKIPKWICFIRYYPRRRPLLPNWFHHRIRYPHQNHLQRTWLYHWCAPILETLRMFSSF